MKKMNIKIHYILFVILLGMAAPTHVQGQFLKKLKKSVEEKIAQKADEKTDEILNGTNGNTSSTKKETEKSTNTQSETKTPPSVPNQKKASTTYPVGTEGSVITYTSPSSDFIDITIQSHKGLPRYGALYFVRGTTKPTDNKAYEKLMELQFLEQTYADINRSKLTKSNSSQQEKGQEFKNSEFAQHHLLQLAGYASSDKVLKEYFCDPEAKSPCNFYNPAGERKHIAYWGGAGKNEFAQNRSYTSFVKNYLEPLQEWSRTFYANGSETVYYVNRALVSEKYDFKNKGYWINNIFSLVGSSFMLHHSEFLPFTENEKALANNAKKHFVPIDPSMAKTLNLQQRSPVFAVLKVKVSPKLSNPTHVAWEYELEDSIIEIYRDAALTNKMGEIDLKTLQSKY
ncbi:MAG: hypothetical protein NXH86_08550 [Flavobacteriaceae bacterium]|uniref:hypothetical protein n=1 Tax=Flagellimonas sp. SN16 TaxID=3415142 RepID=UPI003C627689|nr:hypothetical protein [Flavobacteriaceae bacterium]